MPNKTFIFKLERTAPSYKTAKDRVSLLLYASTSDDCKVKPLMVYTSETSQHLRGEIKSELSVCGNQVRKYDE